MSTFLEGMGVVFLTLVGFVLLSLLWAALSGLSDVITRRRCERTGKPLPPWIRP